MGKPDATRGRPIQHRGYHRARLADKGDVAGGWRQMRETGVETDFGHHDADGIGANEPQQMRAGRVEGGLLQGSAGSAQLA